MKTVIFIFLTCCIAVFSLSYFAFKCGQKDEKQQTVKRAKEIVKECYTNQDIEIIVFGETQGEDESI